MLLLTTLVLITNSKIPDEYKDLVNMALLSSRQKIPKSLRENTKFPGYYEGSNYHYKLLKTTTSYNTHDIKGFAADQSHFAIVKRKMFNIQGDFIFVDPDAEKLYSVGTPLTTEDNIAVYQIKETSIFDIMTDFELHFKSVREEPMHIQADDDQSNTESINKEFTYQWDKTKNIPEYKNIGDYPVQFGYGITTKINLEATFTFKGLLDVKFVGTAEFEGSLGAGVKIPKGTNIKFDDKEYNSGDFRIPGIGKSFSFFGYNIAFGALFSIGSKLTNMNIDIPSGVNYFIGYKVHAMKYFEITPNTIVDNEWKLDLIPLSNENPKTSYDKEASIDTASFDAVLKLIPMISFDINITSLKLNAKVGLGIPIQIKLSFNNEKCTFPYLMAKVDIPFSMILKFPEIKILGKVIIEEIDIESELDKYKVEFTPFCLSEDLFKEASDGLDSSSISYQSITIVQNAEKYEYTWKSEENEKYFKVKVPDVCKDNYLFFVTEKATVHFEIESNTIPRNDENGYAFNYDFVKVTNTEVPFLLKKKLPVWEDAIINFYFVFIEDGNVPTALFTELNEFHFKTGLLTPVLFPLAGNRMQAISNVEGLALPYQYTVRDDLVLFFISLSKGDTASFALIYSRIGDKEPYLNFDLSNVATIFETAPSEIIKSDTFPFYLFCNNAKSVELVQNGKVILTAVEEKQEDDKDETAKIGRFIFNIPNNMKGEITFIPVCKDKSGVMCQLTYDAPNEDGYYIINYPNLDGISTTGSGFYVEAIKITAGESFNYYKTYPEEITTGKRYSEEQIVVNPRYETVEARNNYKRVCLYDETESIIPFSRKYYSENLNDLLKQLNLKVPENDYSGISSDKDGCIVFLASLLPSDDAKIYITKDVSDIPIVPIEPPPKNIKHICICDSETICKECTNGIESNEVETVTSISNDPGDEIAIRVYSDVEISSSIFTNNHKVTVDSRFNLILSNVEKIDLSDTNAIKFDNLVFNNGDNVFAQPKSINLNFNLPDAENRLNVNVNLPDSFTDKLNLIVLNNGENKKASNLIIKGKGEVNTRDYPFDKITFGHEIKGIKGVAVVCSPDGNGNTCNFESLNEYKVLTNVQKVDKKFDKNVKIYFYLYTFKDQFVDVEIDYFDNQELVFIESSSTKLLDGPAKLRVLSTTDLLNTNDDVKISGLEGSTSFSHENVDNIMVGFNNKLTIKQDKGLTGQKSQINIQAQSNNAILVIDETVNPDNSKFKLNSEKITQRFQFIMEVKTQNKLVKLLIMVMLMLKNIQERLMIHLMIHLVIQIKNQEKNQEKNQGKNQKKNQEIKDLTKALSLAL